MDTPATTTDLAHSSLDWLGLTGCCGIYFHIPGLRPAHPRPHPLHISYTSSMSWNGGLNNRAPNSLSAVQAAQAP